jgi:hypothetical protein
MMAWQVKHKKGLASTKMKLVSFELIPQPMRYAAQRALE